MKNTFLLAAAAAATAMGRTYVTCGSWRGDSTGNGQIDNFGMNPVQVYGCNGTASQCVIGNPQMIACPNLLLPGNSTLYINVVAEMLVVEYRTPLDLPYDYHGIQSAAALQVTWPSTSTVNMPYPTNDTLLCDTDADCYDGGHCITSPSPARCASAVPSSSPAAPTPQPVPTPPSGPSAAACNLTGTWLQPHEAASPAQHSADAFVNITAVDIPTGQLSFICISRGGLCPGGNGYNVNGTGVLSSSDHSFTLTPSTGGTPITGIVNNTLSCQVLTITSPARTPSISWQYDGQGPPPPLNIEVTAATFLGGGQQQFVATGVTVLSAAKTGSTSRLRSASTAGASLIAVAGNGQATFASLTPITLLGAAADANGTIVVFSADTSAAPGSGVKPMQVVKVGVRIDHIRSNAAGQVVIAGDFGVAMITGLGGTGQAAAPAVAWHDVLTDVQPGSCGVCCTLNGNSNTTCKVDIGEDGTVLVNYASTSAVGDLWGAYTASGTRFAQMAQKGAASLDSIAVDSANKHLLVGYFYNSNTGKEPMVMPRVTYYTYDPNGVTKGVQKVVVKGNAHAQDAAVPVQGVRSEPVSSASSSSSSPLVRDFDNFPWDAHVYRTPGQPCNGDVADGRVMGLRVGQDGTLLFMGRSDGGDSPFFCGMRDSNRSVTFAQIDGYTSAYNMQSQAITNFMRVDPVLGETIVAQQMLVRLPSNQRGNTMITLGAQSDAKGNVYLLQAAGCCIANMGNLTVNGQPLMAPGDAAVLQILSPSMETRYHWTHFNAPNASGGSDPVDIDVKGGTVAFLMNSASTMVTAGALPNTGPNVGGLGVGYLVVMPTVAA